MLIYRRDGTPYQGLDAMEQWGKDFNDKKRILKQETLKNGFFISTVWLGIDHGFGIGKPLIFETMVFVKNKFADLDMARYSTEQEAIAGHKKMVAKWKRKKRQK